MKRRISVRPFLDCLRRRRPGPTVAPALATISLAMSMAAAAALAQVPGRPELPERLAGAYASDATACRDKAADSRVTISPKSIVFPESTALPREVIELPDGTVVVLADHEGEGDSWSTISAFTLGADRQSLTMFTPADGLVAQLGIALIRCPPRK